MIMTALRAMDSKAESSPYAQNNLASSETNILPALPDGIRKRFRRQCIISSYAAETTWMKSSLFMLSLQVKTGGVIGMDEGKSHGGGST